MIEMPCPTCQRGTRETVGMVCQTCGRDYGPPTPAPGGRTRDAREQIAREQIAAVLRARGVPIGQDITAADAILTDVPAVADALALRERVEALAEEFAFLGASLHDVPRAETFREAAADLRRALDGPP